MLPKYKLALAALFLFTCLPSIGQSIRYQCIDSRTTAIKIQSQPCPPNMLQREEAPDPTAGSGWSNDAYYKALARQPAIVDQHTPGPEPATQQPTSQPHYFAGAPWEKSPKEAAASGVVIFLMIVLLVAAIKAIKWLFSSKSEGAKRLRIVVLVSVVLSIGAAIISVGGIQAAAITVAVLVAIIWVLQGFNKN